MSKPDAIASDSAAPRPSTPKYTLVANDAKFSLGQVVATPGALALMERTDTNSAVLLNKHIHGDWGDICAEDCALNGQALTDGSRLMSVYRLISHQTLATTAIKKRAELLTVVIITEAVGNDGRRASTCIFLPKEY